MLRAALGASVGLSASGGSSVGACLSALTATNSGEAVLFNASLASSLAVAANASRVMGVAASTLLAGAVDGVGRSFKGAGIDLYVSTSPLTDLHL